MKYVRCMVDAWGHNYGIHNGKVYPVQGENLYCGRPTYVLLTNTGTQEFSQKEFDIVGCPCPVRNCISKHKERSKIE
jgi:hypothetical protein